MKEIASFIKQIVIDKSDPKQVANSVFKFREQFQKVQYAFENSTDAYEYIKIRT
jgi:glycine hydroxymethyltransferase